MTENKMTTQEKIDMFYANTNKRAAFDFKNRRQELVEDFLDSGYFTSSTQELMFKRMLKEIHEAMKNQNETQNCQVRFNSATYHAFEQLITGIQDLFPEAYMMVRYFKYYAGTSQLNNASSTDILNVVVNISKRDRSKFERLKLTEMVQDEQENVDVA